MQEHQGQKRSLYIPAHHAVQDVALLHEFMDEFPFVELITAGTELRISHIPVLLDRDRGRLGTVYGHVARQNPQATMFGGDESAVVVFRGPHMYISPSWYANPNTVPTWNYAAVHATGKLRAVEETTEKGELLRRLVERFEDKPRTGYDLTALPAATLEALLANIAVFAMEVDGLEGKFKLGQERSEADRQGILRHLPDAPQERTLLALTAAFYERLNGG